MNEETKEVLNAMKDMFNILTDKMDIMQKDFTDKMDTMQKDVSSLKQDMVEVKQRLTNVENKVSKIETTLENETNRNIKLLVDGYASNTEKLDRIEPIVKKVKEKTDIIELAVKSHSRDINRLKQVK